MKTNLPSKTIITIFILFLNITVVKNLKAQVTLDWVTQIGSTGGEEGHSIVADSLGNTYVLGTYPSGNNLLDFDNSSNTVTLPVGNGFITAFLAKFDVNGNLIWVNSVIDNNSTTSNNYIYPQELSIDNNNNIIVFSSFNGSTFDADPSSGVLTLNNPGSEAILVSKFNSLGNLIWATTAAYSTSNLGGIDPHSVDIDSQNNIFLTGIFRRTIQFTASDSITSANDTNLSLYVIKLDPSGNFLWAKTPNTSSPQNQYSIGYSIHLDNSDNVMVTGSFYGDVDFDLGAGAHVVTSAAPFPNADLFVLKLDNNGDFIWVKNYGNANGRLLGIDVNTDATGNIIIAGALSNLPSGLVDIDPGGAVLNINNGGAYESFVLKLDANGNNQWIKNIAANTTQTELFNIATDNCGNIYSIGRFKGTCDFDPGPTTFNMTSGFQNIFISKLDSSGNFVWAHNFGEGSTFADKDNDIFIDNNSNIYFTAGMGTNNPTSPAADFDPGIGTYMLTTNGRFDIVLGKLIDCCMPTIAQPISFVGTTTFCNGDSIILDAGAGYSNYQWLPSNDTTQLITVSSSGNYAVIVSDNCGTDTSQTITITVNPSSSFNQTIIECQGFSTTVGTNTYNTTGVYTDTLTASTGCDSIITTNLTINSAATGIDVQTACGSFTWIDGNTYTSSTNTPTYTYVGGAVNGCDSVVTLNLTINNSSSATINPVACNSYTSPSGNYTWTSSGTYTDTIPNTSGCDSIITVNLTINTPATGTDIQTACGSFTWIDGITYTSSTNTPTDTIVGGAASGCDSIVTLNLTINTPATGTDVQTACGSFTWIDGNTYTSSTNTPTDTLFGGAANGCDSIVTLNLTINNSTTSTINPTTCNSYTSPSGNYTWTSSGTYSDTIPNAAGCDSIITINLTITPPTTTTNVYNECEGFSVTVGSNTYNSTGVYTDINGCDTIITDLTIIPIPQITLIKADDNCGENIGSVTVIASSNNPPITYTWNTGSTDSTISNLPVGTYSIIVKDSSDCAAADSVNINDFQIDCDYFIYIPNMFSPNGDGQNDVFYVRGKGIATISIKIYNRWGNKVFESNDINQGWDGTFKGSDQNTAVFVYVLEATFSNGKTVTESGDITLIR